MALTAAERERFRSLVSRIYSEGYSEGALQAANEYDLRDKIPDASVRMEKPLKQRLSLADKAVDDYIKLIERRTDKLRGQGLSGDMLFAQVTNYAQHLADSKAEIIAEMEFAEARLDGAGHIMDEAGIKYEWRFPHHPELGRPGHVECAVCAAIRTGAPYTQSEAEAKGFPFFPHPHCDHLWVITPVGEKP